MNEIDSFDFSNPAFKPSAPATAATEIDGFDFSGQIQPKVLEERKESFIDRTAPQLKERNERMLKDLVSGFRGDVPVQEAALNIVGELAGSALDVLGEGLVSTGRVISAVTPDAVKEPVSELASELATKFMQSPAGQSGLIALEGGIETYREWKSGHPREARAIENTFNIGVVFAPVKVKKNASPSLLSKSSDKIKKAADSQIKGSRKKFVETLIGPKRDLKVLKDEVSRTTEVGSGPFKRSIVSPGAREVEIAKEVSKIKAVQPKNSIQGNYIEISKANVVLAKQLEKDVASSGVTMPRQKVIQAIDDTVDRAVSENIFVVGNGVAAAEKMKLNASKIIIKHSDDAGNLSGAGLLAARKEFDSLVKAQKRDIFNPGTADSSIKIITKDIRNSMNKILDESVTGSRAVDSNVKDELKRQSLLFGALENMEAKAAAEKNHALLRALDNAIKIVPWKNEAVQLFAVMAGVGGLGAAAMGAGPFRTGAGIVGTAYIGHKIIMSPGNKRAAASVLKFADQAIRTSENPAMLKSLRADRALIVELLDNSVTEEDK